MKKIISMIVGLSLLACLSLGISGCGSDKTGLDYVKEKKTLVVGFTDFPPFGYMENGEYLGFDLELAKLVCDKLLVTFKAQYIDWDAQVLEINSKKVDCIWNGMTITEKRKENMIFSKPYFQTNLVAITTKDSNINSISDLANKRIGVESNGTADINLSENELYNKNLLKFTTVSEVLLALEGNQIDAMVVDATYANDYIMKKSAASNKYKIVDGTVGDIEEYGIAFRKEDATLKDAVDKAIDELLEEGKIAPILEKYFGKSNGFKR